MGKVEGLIQMNFTIIDPLSLSNKILNLRIKFHWQKSFIYSMLQLGSGNLQIDNKILPIHR